MIAALVTAADIQAFSPEERYAYLASLTPQLRKKLRHFWKFWARENQLIPENVNPRTEDGSWTTWLIDAGRGFGKTRTGAETTRQWVKDYRYVNLVGATADDARDIMVEGESGILAICPRHERPAYKKAERKLIWPNGAISLIFTADEPDRARGKQSEKLWCLVGNTQVTMGDGSHKAIKDIKADEFVLTRKGPRRVLAVSSHVDTVGRVAFSNGSEIVGTGKHPMIQCNGVTICLKDLSTGDCVPTDTSVLTLAQSTNTEDRHWFTSIDISGNRPMVGCPRVMSSTIKTGIAQIIGSATLNARAKQATLESTLLGTPTAQASRGPFRMCNVPTADAILNAAQGSRFSDVRAAQQSEQSQNAKSQGLALSVEHPLSQDEGSSVASVVSTWEVVGSAEVFDLGIEGEPEFFANGLLSHNCDEVAAWRYRDAWDQLMLGLRLGDSPQCVATTTPKPTELMKEILADPTTLVTRGSTYDNRANLAEAFFSRIIKKYEGTRLGRQELNAEMLEDNPGALWNRKMIDATRVGRSQVPASLARIVVGVDPAVTSTEESDETGIVVAARDDNYDNPHFYVFADMSIAMATPDQWASRSVEAYDTWKADRIAGEVNNGGDLVETVIRHKRPLISFESVHASRGKIIRAEPIAALYEQGRVHHVGSFPTLEDQMCDYNPDTSKKSPDRMDALVWALTQLSSDDFSPEPVTAGSRRMS